MPIVRWIRIEPSRIATDGDALHGRRRRRRARRARERGRSDRARCPERARHGLIPREREGEGDARAKAARAGRAARGETVLDDRDARTGESTAGKGAGGGDANV